MKAKVYWTSIEYKYDKTKRNLLGGFVYAFITAFDVTDALEKILNELKAQKLSPNSIEFIKPYDSKLEWESLEQTKHFNKLYKTAQRSSKVVFDDFYAYEAIK